MEEAVAVEQGSQTFCGKLVDVLETAFDDRGVVARDAFVDHGFHVFPANLHRAAC